MCEICTDVIDLLQKYEVEYRQNNEEIRALTKVEITTLCTHVQAWTQKQCSCCYKDLKNFERFNFLIQGLIQRVIELIKDLLKTLPQNEASTSCKETSKDDEPDELETAMEDADGGATAAAAPEEIWTLEDKEKLLHFASKVFLLNFPLYMAFKHSVHSKLEEISQEEIGELSNFCDVNDLDIPVYLLRNVCYLCEKGGVRLFASCFEKSSPATLPLSLAHSMICIVANLKLWMNIGYIMQLLVPLRSSVIRYLCKMSDNELRVSNNRAMFEFMWTAVKDPLDAHASFDKEGLDLAFKYFSSTTLTMRLAGIAQINCHINMYNELCHSDSIVEVECVGRNLANWLIENKIVEHIFGPNLHVEIIKQSQVVLNFLAMESRLTSGHVEAIWAAAQLKHCSRQVLELLPPLLKDLELGPACQLYSLLAAMEPRDHTEQTLLLASALTKYLWMNGSTGGVAAVPTRDAATPAAMAEAATLSPFSLLRLGQNIPGAAFPPELPQQKRRQRSEVSSSERSVSVEASNSEDEHGDVQMAQVTSEIDSSQVSDRPRSSCEEEATADSSPEQLPNVKMLPGKWRKKKRRRCQPEEVVVSSGDESDVTSDDSEHGSIHIPTCLPPDSGEDSQKSWKGRHKRVKTSDSLLGEDKLEDSLDPAQVPAKKEESDEEYLVKAVLEGDRHLAGRFGMDHEMYSCQHHYMSNFHSRRHHISSELVEDILSPDEGSCNSSHVSNKSEKNMGDFEEESCCEDELVALAGRPMTQRLANMACLYNPQPSGPPHRGTGAKLDLDAVCKPGQTILWDLLQDDKIHKLADGMAAEAEKILCNLVCWSSDKLLRMKFIEGCLDNLSKNSSVIVSLRLLPKLLSSFTSHQYRTPNTDGHFITMWADREHKMMKHFFNNLIIYTQSLKTGQAQKSPLYSHKDQIQVRLTFLTCVYNMMSSPQSLRLTVDQVDILWSSLATDPECADELFNWLLNQVKDKEEHGLCVSLAKYLLLEKLPQLPPETTSMVALHLLQQLTSTLLHQAPDMPEANISGMQQLWRIALRAQNTEVSTAAIQFLNAYYLNGQHGSLEHEEEFIERCMQNLTSASQTISEAEDKNLTVIQRALLLLKTHIEVFSRRYAYHLRMMKLKGQGIKSHRDTVSERHASPLRVVCQPAIVQERTTIEMHPNDFVADLRAEITFWWEELQAEARKEQKEKEGSSPAPILGTILTEGPIRMITEGQELTADLDEKSLNEMNFKDQQLVFVSVGAARALKKKDSDPMSCLPPPPASKLPLTLLLQPPYFEELFSLMHQLGSMRATNKNGDQVPHTKAQVLSRRIWEILMMLPTSPQILQGFKDFATKTEEAPVTLQSLVDPSTPSKLMYSLQIVESLLLPTSPTVQSPKSTDPSLPDSSASFWTEKFIEHGGLRHLFDIFTSGVLQVRDGEPEWNEWNQDCMTCMLKLIYQFGTIHPEPPQEGVAANQRKKIKKKCKGSFEKMVVVQFNQTLLQMMGDTDRVVRCLLEVLSDASRPCDPNQYRTGFFGKAQLVHAALTLLVSWAFSQPGVRAALLANPNLPARLKRLVLEDPEPGLRREACMGLNQLCLGTSPDGTTGHGSVTPLLQHLLDFLPFALSMKPTSRSDEYPSKGPLEDEKEPYGPGCKDYFFLLCRLIDSMDEDMVQEASQDPKSLLNLETLARFLADAIVEREFRETRHNTVEDDGLRGLLNLCTAVMKHNPLYKTSKEGEDLVQTLFDCLFLLPSPSKRYLPKCKSHGVRSACFDLLVELVRGREANYRALHAKLYAQHGSRHLPYPWDYWPHDDGRAECGYVGLTNLGATCYLASCMQHLYMMPWARASILAAQIIPEMKHESTLREIQRMFAYLLESERKAYNPRSFCKVYTMNHQPLNTGEQKDMAEFFTDLISKLEEMTPELKELVKTLFCGVLSNNVVSLDCPHISRTTEEFYTLRCQVADMRNLYESLDELTVKDTLEGDNMYTCSQCGKKVRAEKRACIKKLPKILCFNTMRYTFNMVTMTKEKVNTHFSFPFRLDMKHYVERNLIPKKSDEGSRGDAEEEEEESSEYDLIGVTVHTGTADGGHYYSFIKERQTQGKDKWFLFNDAEVKPFDPIHLAAECFGGEMTSKTYDSVTDKFMDFSFEKTNSAYMLFYERAPSENPSSQACASLQSPSELAPEAAPNIELSPELASWIWEDNMQFLQDKSIFEHTYFNFMWQICGYIPTTIPNGEEKEFGLLTAKLGTAFVLETLIHAKEKPTIAQWIELLTKHFNSNQTSCEWFLQHMAEDPWWPIQILIKCPNQVVRQLFQRLCIHVINQLKPKHSQQLYLQPYGESNDSSDVENPPSCVARFVKKLLSLMEQGGQQHVKHLTEYFTFLLEFSKMGEEESQFMLSIETISTLVNFYLKQKSTDCVEVVSDEEEEEEDEVAPTVDDRTKPASLEKMITLIAVLVEKSRTADQRLHLSHQDFNLIAGGKGFPFLHQQIRDSINLRQTGNLIFSVCRWNEHLAVHIINMIFLSIAKQSESNGSFFKLLSMLVELMGGHAGMPSFTNMILQRIWEAAEYCPQQCLEWLTVQSPRNKLVHAWVLQSMDSWVEKYLIAHATQRVRNVAAMLLVALVPSNHFRQTYRSSRAILTPQKEIVMSSEALLVLHQIYDLLLRLLKRAKLYVEHTVHGTTKLTSYFAVMTYCLVSNTEKLMFSQYFVDLWNLFQPKLSEPAIPVHHNKQALLSFWYQVCVDCPENVKLIVQNTHVTKNIAFNYILADHDDQEVVIFNRCMLPAYYGLLRLCCQQSRSFTRHLASHQNIQWAFKNITPYTTQYATAINELFKLMKLFVGRYPDQSEQEIREVAAFKRTTLRLYLTVLDARACWATLISALRILTENNEDRLMVINNNGLPLLFQALHTLHMMFHEATACHVTGDIIELLAMVLDLLKAAQSAAGQEEPPAQSWRELPDAIRRLLTLLNSYTPAELRHSILDVLQEIVVLYPEESLDTLIPLLSNCHTSFLENNSADFPVVPGPYFPQRGGGQKLMPTKTNIRPPRPIFQMFLHPSQLEAIKANGGLQGVDVEYDQALCDFYMPYHHFIDTLCRVAIRQDIVTPDLVNLSAMVAVEGIPLHSPIMPKLWLDIMHTEQANREFLPLLYSASYLVDYLETVLLDERASLNHPTIYEAFTMLLPQVSLQVINNQVLSLLSSVMTNLIKTLDSTDLAKQAHKINGDLRALTLVYSLEKPAKIPPDFPRILHGLSEHCNQLLLCEKESQGSTESGKSDSDSSSEEHPPPKRRKLSGGAAEGSEEGHWAAGLNKTIRMLLDVLEGSSPSQSV